MGRDECASDDGCEGGATDEEGASEAGTCDGGSDGVACDGRREEEVFVSSDRYVRIRNTSAKVRGRPTFLFGIIIFEETYKPLALDKLVQKILHISVNLIIYKCG